MDDRAWPHVCLTPSVTPTRHLDLDQSPSPTQPVVEPQPYGGASASPSSAMRYPQLTRRVGPDAPLYLHHLSCISEESLESLRRRCLMRWLLWSHWQRATRSLEKRALAESLLALGRRYLLNWMAPAVQSVRAKEQRAKCSQLSARFALQWARDLFSFWRSLAAVRVERVREAEGLSQVNAVRLASLQFNTWRRRRHTRQRLEAMLTQQSTERTRHAFSLWLQFRAQRLTLHRLARCALRQYARNCFSVWVRCVERQRELRRIQHRGCWALSRLCLNRWREWLKRRVLAVHLEQANVQRLARSVLLKWSWHQRLRMLYGQKDEAACVAKDMGQEGPRD